MPAVVRRSTTRPRSSAAGSRSSKLRERTGRDFHMPILHLSQLIGVAAGLEESELKFKRHVVPVTPMLEKLEV